MELSNQNKKYEDGTFSEERDKTEKCGMTCQCHVQTENGTIQMLWVPKKISTKMNKRKIKFLFSDKSLK